MKYTVHSEGKGGMAKYDDHTIALMALNIV